MLIGAEFVTGHGEIENVLDPATGMCIAEVRAASSQQVSAAVQAATRAFPAWAATVPKDRAAALLRIAASRCPPC
jgi:aminobutyraldehyde dehydrogenase